MACGERQKRNVVNQLRRVLCLGVLFFAASGQASEAPQITMALLGDSVAASTFAGTVAGARIDGRDAFKLLRALSLQYRLPATSEEYLRRVGLITSYPEFNAFTGDFEWSHRRRIEIALGASVRTHNYSIPGAKTDHLFEQVGRLKRDFQYSALAPQYIVFHVGGNDFCDGVSADRAALQLYDAIRDLRSAFPSAAVLVTGIPDIVTIFENYERKAFSFGPIRLSCRERAERFQMCARSAEFLWGTPGERQQARRELKGFRERFHEVTQALNHEDLREGSVTFAQVHFDGDPYLSLAADCFHPGMKGHEDLARQTWEMIEPALNSTLSTFLRSSGQDLK